MYFYQLTLFSVESRVLGKSSKLSSAARNRM